MPLENFDDLAAAWELWMKDTYISSTGKVRPTQGANWRNDNPGEWEKLENYYNSGPRPTLASHTGNMMLEIVDAIIEARGIIEPPPVETGNARLVAQAVYDGYSDVDEVPLWKTHDEQARSEDRMTVVTDPLGKYNKVMQVIVQPGDSQVAGSGGGERADVMASSNAVPMRPGGVLVVRCPIMLPTEFRSNGSGWNVPFGQHDQSGGTQSPVQFEIRNDKEFRLRLLGGTKNTSTGMGTYRSDHMLKELAKNRWYDLMYGFFYSPDSTKGRAVVMLDNVKVLDITCANIYAGSYSYHKQGWYRVATPYPTKLFFHDTKFWTADTLDYALAAAAK